MFVHFCYKYIYFKPLRFNTLFGILQTVLLNRISIRDLFLEKIFLHFFYIDFIYRMIYTLCVYTSRLNSTHSTQALIFAIDCRRVFISSDRGSECIVYAYFLNFAFSRHISRGISTTRPSGDGGYP